MSRFRLPRAVLLDLLDVVLGPALERSTCRNYAMPVPLQVLVSGNWHIPGGTGISQPTFSYVMPAVLGGIIGLLQQYIKFPYTVSEQANKKAQFAAMLGFPNVIGAIDCTHVAIRASSENEFAFINRKHFHSLNVQLICDSDMLLTNIVTRWPGSTNDSFILRHSSVGRRLEDGAVRDGWLLGTDNKCGKSKSCNFLLVFNPFTDLAGDSGCPLKRWLLTPFPNPQSAEERTYNLRHSKAHTVGQVMVSRRHTRNAILQAREGLHYCKSMCCATQRGMAKRCGLAPQC